MWRWPKVRWWAHGHLLGRSRWHLLRWSHLLPLWLHWKYRYVLNLYRRFLHSLSLNWWWRHMHTWRRTCAESILHKLCLWLSFILLNLFLRYSPHRWSCSLLWWIVFFFYNWLINNFLLLQLSISKLLLQILNFLIFTHNLSIQRLNLALIHSTLLFSCLYFQIHLLDFILIVLLFFSHLPLHLCLHIIQLLYSLLHFNFLRVFLDFLWFGSLC